VVGQRHLHDDILRDAGGMVRVVLRTPNWEDFVTLACREIRLYGAANFQVARRLRAMLEDLLHTLPEARGTRRSRRSCSCWTGRSSA